MLNKGRNAGRPGVFVPGRRQRINLLAICVNLFTAPLLFTVLFAIMSFKAVHYEHPSLAWCCVFLSFIIVLITGFAGFVSKLRDQDPMWYTFATIMLFLATCFATILGDLNFWYCLEPYYEMDFLNTYPGVNPEKGVGQLFMDAGRVYFAEGTRLDVQKAMGFKHVDLYCVAPIVSGSVNRLLPTYDFWAVGLNCCGGHSHKFRCGEYNNAHARSGLRVMQLDQTPFFRLAVQQAEAAYNLKANHPLFFYWLQDPVHAMNEYRDAGYKFFATGVFAYFVFNLFCVFVGVFCFSKLGSHYGEDTYGSTNEAVEALDMLEGGD